jgi:hypothetical protein
MQLTLVIARDGTASLSNRTAAPLIVDGYEVLAKRPGVYAGDGTMNIGGWVGIADVARRAPETVVSQLGEDALGFAKTTSGRGYAVAELSISGQAVFQPGASWSIGQLFVPPPEGVAMRAWYSLLLAGAVEWDPRRSMGFVNGFFYHSPDIGGNKFEGAIAFEGESGPLPEPATLALLGIGGLAVVLRRGRRTRGV